MSAALPCEREPERERSRSPMTGLLRSAGRARSIKPLRKREGSRSVADLRLLHNPSHVLIVGADPVQRASLLDQLARSMPAHTPFTEASAISEVLESAPASRMVVLSGDLDDAPAESLMRLLGHRHPRLPIVSIGTAAAPSRLRAYA
jgi:hypothetical protein